MYPFSFIHAADLHLDVPFSGISEMSSIVLSRLRDASFKAFENVISVAIEKKVDFLLLSGDIYNHEERSLRAQVFLQKQLKILADNNIATFMIHGNHDYLKGSKINLKLNDKVCVFDKEKVGSASAFNKEGKEVAKVYGISFADRNFSKNPVDAFKREDDLPFAIGLLHTNVGGNSAHDNYAPCAKSDLLDAGFDYWALGHVHTHALLSEKNPTIVYPGTTQARSVRETGSKGCCYVMVDDAGSVDVSFCQTSNILWFEEVITLSSDLDNVEELLYDRLEEVTNKISGTSGVVRWVIKGSLFASEIVELLENQIFVPGEGLTAVSPEDIDGEFLWSSSVIDKTTRIKAVSSENIVEDVMKISDDLLLACDKWSDSGEISPLLQEALDEIDSLWKNRIVKKTLKKPDPELIKMLIGQADNLVSDAFMRNSE